MTAGQEPNAPGGELPREVRVVAHTMLFYWWPVWAVGFLMAGLTYWEGYQVAFVPPGTVAERERRIEGYEGPRDILIAPAGQPLFARLAPDVDAFTREGFGQPEAQQQLEPAAPRAEALTGER